MDTQELDLRIYTKKGELRKNGAGNLNKPTTHGRRVCFRLALDIERYADHAISEKGVTMSDWLNELIREDMKKRLFETIK